MKKQINMEGCNEGVMNMDWVMKLEGWGEAKQKNGPKERVMW